MPTIDVPANSELDKAAAIINTSAKVMILAGRGALKARDEVLQLV